MRRLILLRHAKTERDAPSGHDIDRRLDERGRQDCESVGRWLARHGYSPEIALVSNAARARETWALLSKFFPATRAEERPELYNADTGDLLALIHAAEIADPKTLMILAHNPALHELALALIATGEMAGRHALAANLPTAGVVIIDFDTDSWGDAGFRKGALERFVSPKILKDWPDTE